MRRVMLAPFKNDPQYVTSWIMCANTQNVKISTPPHRNHKTKAGTQLSLQVSWVRQCLIVELAIKLLAAIAVKHMDRKHVMQNPSAIIIAKCRLMNCYGCDKYKVDNSPRERPQTRIQK